jgi:hypothetical protein
MKELFSRSSMLRPTGPMRPLGFASATYRKRSGQKKHMKPSDILKIETLDGNWRDKDSVMLHACFQLLKDCVEKENLLNGHTDWGADEKHRKAKIEIEELYNWWLSYTESDIPDEEQYEIETNMLVRLVAIRWALWT